MAGRGDPHTDSGSILKKADLLSGRGIYLNVTVGALPQGEIAIRRMIVVGKDCVSYKGARAAIAAYRIAETYLLRRTSVGVQVHLQRVRGGAFGREFANTDTPPGIGHGPGGAYGLESPKSRADLGDHTGYIVKFRFQSMEFDVEPSVAAS